MGAQAAKYAYLHGRVSVLAESLLDDERFEALIQSGADEEMEILRAAGLSNLTPEITTDFQALEQVLIAALIRDTESLARALNGTARDLLMYWARRFELSNVKAILRGKMAEESMETIQAQLVEVGTFATLPIDDLLRTDDVAELLRLLERTPYADIARQARQAYESQQDLFALDATVDRRYFTGLTKRAKEVDIGDWGQLRVVIGTIVDRMNLTWLLRYRFSYGLAPAETYYLLIPAGYQISSTRLLTLSQLGSLEEILAGLPEPYKTLLAEHTTITGIDRTLESLAAWRAHGILRRTTFNLARALAYLVLRERDIGRIHAVIKGKRLDMPAELIGKATGTLRSRFEGRFGEG